MTLKLFDQKYDQRLAVDDATGLLHYVNVNGDGDITDIKALNLATSPAAVTPVEKSIVWFEKVVSEAGAGVPLFAFETPVLFIHFQAKKATGSNAGNIYVKNLNVHKTTAQGEKLEQDECFKLPSIAGVKYNAQDISIDADNDDDGVSGYYVPV